jgi:hypothetical protein
LNAITVEQSKKKWFAFSLSMGITDYKDKMQTIQHGAHYSAMQQG